MGYIATPYLKNKKRSREFVNFFGRSNKGSEELE
jgi:hypothetical protein